MQTLTTFLLSLLLCIFLSACTKQQENDATSSDVNAQLAAPSQRMQFEVRQTELMNLPGGPDYQTLISLYQNSGLPEEERLLDMGSAIVGSHNDARVTSRPSQSLDEGIVMLEKAASGAGETARIAADLLARYFEKGVGIPSDMALLPQPEITQCWRNLLQEEKDKLASAKTRAQECILLRQKLATPVK
jgi:hypothetical protein